MDDTLHPREHQLRRACAELRDLLRAGEPGRAEAVFARHPELAGDAGAALEVLSTEWVARKEAEPPPPAEDLFRRFPQWKDRLGRLLRSTPAWKKGCPARGCATPSG